MLGEEQWTATVAVRLWRCSWLLTKVLPDFVSAGDGDSLLGGIVVKHWHLPNLLGSIPPGENLDLAKPGRTMAAGVELGPRHPGHSPGPWKYSLHLHT